MQGQVAKVIPLLPGGSRALEKADREHLINYATSYRSARDEWLRREIIEHDRIDLLAREVLGYKVKAYHAGMLRFQFLHPDNQQWGFRGAGKTSMLTVTKAIHLLCKCRDMRILIASKTVGNSEGFLKEIKAHLEGNTRLIELFGTFYDPHRVGKWDNREIEVVGRKTMAKEASVTCVGVEGTVVSRHYDVIISDDLIDEDNARTKHMRDRVRTWYYQTLIPCLEPAAGKVPHQGEHHRHGTRYHYDDLYGHLQKHELKDHTNIVKALSEDELSPWPEYYPPSHFKKIREISGSIIFNCQFQCDTESMRGEVFQYDDCQPVEDADVPSNLHIYMGIDLAISKKQTADMFAVVVGGIDSADNCYVIDYFEGHLRFSEQTAAIQRLYRQYDPVRAAIETNAYQAAQYQRLKDRDREMRLVGIHQDKDKTTRAHKLSARFEAKRMYFRRSTAKLVDQLVGFPGHRYDDGFDALDMMIGVSQRRARRRRRRTTEPGLM